QRAYEIGLYNRVVPGEELEALGKEWAQRLADGPTMGLSVTKRMLTEEASMTLADAMQAEGWVQAECMKHPDYREAYEAFMEKRPKNFVQHAAFRVRGGGKAKA
ncbi:MAG: enoyl-CoA hydratase-related protein, partial [Planctomycetota bacterium]